MIEIAANAAIATVIEIAANAAIAAVMEIAATVNGKTRVADIMEIGTEIGTTEIAATGTGVNILDTAIVITTLDGASGFVPKMMMAISTAGIASR